MHTEIQDILTNITAKAKRIKLRNERLEAEVAALRETVFTHLGTINVLKQKIDATEKLNVVSAIANKDTVDAKNIRKTIDAYIKVIDNSIATLKQKD